MPLTVGIAGITGRVGSLIAMNLLSRPSVVVHGYCRSRSKVSPSIYAADQSRVHITEGDAFDADKIAEFVKPCDVVACAYLGDDKLMVEGQKLLIDACEAARVPRFVAGDWSLDYRRLELGELPPKDPMKHIKSYLETKTHVRGVHVLNGVFMEVMFSPMFGAFDLKNKAWRYWGDGTEILEATTYETAAQFTAEVMLDPTAFGVQAVLGDRKNAKEIVKIYEEVYGEPLTLQRLGSLDELDKLKNEARAQHPNDIYKWMGLFYIYHMLNGRTLIGPDVNSNRYPDVSIVDIKKFMESRSPEKLAGSR
jgi:putative NADH-flavin reductase